MADFNARVGYMPRGRDAESCWSRVGRALLDIQSLFIIDNVVVVVAIRSHGERRHGLWRIKWPCCSLRTW